MHGGQIVDNLKCQGKEFWLWAAISWKLLKDTEQTSNTLKVVFQEDLSAISAEKTLEGEEHQDSKIVQRKKAQVKIILGTSQSKSL